LAFITAQRTGRADGESGVLRVAQVAGRGVSARQCAGGCRWCRGSSRTCWPRRHGGPNSGAA